MHKILTNPGLLSRGIIDILGCIIFVVDHILSDLSTKTRPFWVAPHGMA